MLIKVTGRSAAPIPNRNSDPATSDEVEWNNVTNKNESRYYQARQESIIWC